MEEKAFHNKTNKEKKQVNRDKRVKEKEANKIVQFIHQYQNRKVFKIKNEHFATYSQPIIKHLTQYTRCFSWNRLSKTCDS